MICSAIKGRFLWPSNRIAVVLNYKIYEEGFMCSEFFRERENL